METEFNTPSRLWLAAGKKPRYIVTVTGGLARRYRLAEYGYAKSGSGDFHSAAANIEGAWRFALRVVEFAARMARDPHEPDGQIIRAKIHVSGEAAKPVVLR